MQVHPPTKENIMEAAYGYKVGDWIEIVATIDEHSTASVIGRRGPIAGFRDQQALTGREGDVQVWVDWTCGSGLMLVFPDDLHKVKLTDLRLEDGQ
jgi:hypothetical protein